MRSEETEVRGQRSETRKDMMKTTTYQVERKTAKDGWETLAPTIGDEAEAICLLRAQRINARVTRSGAEFRLRKTVKSVVRC